MLDRLFQLSQRSSSRWVTLREGGAAWAFVENLAKEPMTGLLGKMAISIRKFQSVAKNGGKDISGPLLVIQGAADPIIYPPTVEAAVSDTAKIFPTAQTKLHVLPNVTHVSVMYARLSIYHEWINAGFAGEAAKSRLVASPARPPSGLKTEANWFIQKQLEPYQMT